MGMLTSHAAYAGVKLILVGDDRQLSSIDRGGMFGALKDRHGAAELTEVKRQHKNDHRRASEMMAEGNFNDALKIYEQTGAVNWTRTQPEARAELIEKWAQDSAQAPEKSRFVFAYTNEDVGRLNAGLRAVRKERGELGDEQEIHTAHGRAMFAVGDRIQFTKTDKKIGINNNDAGTIEAMNGKELTVSLDKGKKRSVTFNAELYDKFRHGYAGTIYRGQGRTIDQTYLYHSEHWRSAPSYVALTRHRDKAELFVARNTAKDVKQLARQMARTDERRAASMFKHSEIIPERLLTPAQLLARLAPDAAAATKEEQAPPAASQRASTVTPPATPAAEERKAGLHVIARVVESVGGWLSGWITREPKAAPQEDLKHGGAQAPAAPVPVEEDLRLAETLARAKEENLERAQQEQQQEPQQERRQKRGQHF
jgi:AAA domain